MCWLIGRWANWPPIWPRSIRRRRWPRSVWKPKRLCAWNSIRSSTISRQVIHQFIHSTASHFPHHSANFWRRKPKFDVILPQNNTLSTYFGLIFKCFWIFNLKLKYFSLKTKILTLFYLKTTHFLTNFCLTFKFYRILNSKLKYCSLKTKILTNFYY